MATTTLTGSWSSFRGNPHGPFVHTNGDVYVLTFTGTNLNLYHSTDGGVTFGTTYSVATNLFTTTLTPNRSYTFGATKNGSELTIAWYAASGSNSIVQYRTFDMSTNTLGTTVSFDTSVSSTHVAAAAPMIPVKQSTMGRVFVFRNGTPVTVSMVAYRRVVQDYDIGGSLTSNAPAGTVMSSTTHYDLYGVVPVGNRAHIFYTGLNGTTRTLYCRTLSSAATFGVEQTIATVNNTAYPVGTPWTNGTSVMVPYVLTTGLVSVAYATSADTPTWSTAAVSDTGNTAESASANPAAITHDGTNWLIRWINDAQTSILGDQSSTGATWGTDTTEVGPLTGPIQGIGLSSNVSGPLVLYTEFGSTKLDYPATVVTLSDSDTVTATEQFSVVNSQTTTLTPTADAFTDNGSFTPANADINYGGLSVLEVDAEDTTGGTKHAFIKFSIPDNEHIASAKLRMYTTNLPSSSGVYVYFVSDNSWTELGITGSNQPTIGTQIGTLPVGTLQSTVEATLDTSVFPRNGSLTVALSLSPPSTNGADYDSREGTNPPQLEISYIPSASTAGTPVNATDNVTLGATEDATIETFSETFVTYTDDVAVGSTETESLFGDNTLPTDTGLVSATEAGIFEAYPSLTDTSTLAETNTLDTLGDMATADAGFLSPIEDAVIDTFSETFVTYTDTGTLGAAETADLFGDAIPVTDTGMFGSAESFFVYYEVDLGTDARTLSSTETLEQYQETTYTDSGTLSSSETFEQAYDVAYNDTGTLAETNTYAAVGDMTPNDSAVLSEAVSYDVFADHTTNDAATVGVSESVDVVLLSSEVEYTDTATLAVAETFNQEDSEEVELADADVLLESSEYAAFADQVTNEVTPITSTETYDAFIDGVLSDAATITSEETFALGDTTKYESFTDQGTLTSSESFDIFHVIDTTDQGTLTDVSSFSAQSMLDIEVTETITETTQEALETVQTLDETALLTPIEAWQDTSDSGVVLSDGGQLTANELYETANTLLFDDVQTWVSTEGASLATSIDQEDTTLVTAAETLNTEDSSDLALADVLSFTVTEEATTEGIVSASDTQTLVSSDAIALTTEVSYSDDSLLGSSETLEADESESLADADSGLLTADELFTIYTEFVFADVGTLTEETTYDAVGDVAVVDDNTLVVDDIMLFDQSVSFSDVVAFDSFDMVSVLDLTVRDTELKMLNVSLDYVFIDRGQSYEMHDQQLDYEFISRGLDYTLEEGSMAYTFIRHDD